MWFWSDLIGQQLGTPYTEPADCIQGTIYMSWDTSHVATSRTVFTYLSTLRFIFITMHRQMLQLYYKFEK